MIEPFDSRKLGSYYYNLEIENVFLLGRTPKKLQIDKLPDGGIFVEPGKVLWLRMRERVSLPDNFLASLEQTHHFTRKGLSFLNLSLVFPNYSGFLTCAVANFSSSPIFISKNSCIARLTFFELEKSTLHNQKPRVVNSEFDYDLELLEEAKSADDNFFGLSSLRDDIGREFKEEVEGTIRRASLKSVLAIGALLFFFTVLPVLQDLFTNTWYGDSVLTKDDLREALYLLERRGVLEELVGEMAGGMGGDDPK